jgi:surface protein
MMEALPPEAMAGMGPELMAAMPPHAMGGMDAPMVAAMPPTAMGGMGPEHMAAMPLDAMAGMSPDMMQIFENNTGKNELRERLDNLLEEQAAGWPDISRPSIPLEGPDGVEIKKPMLENQVGVLNKRISDNMDIVDNEDDTRVLEQRIATLEKNKVVQAAEVAAAQTAAINLQDQITAVGADIREKNEVVDALNDLFSEIETVTKSVFLTVHDAVFLESNLTNIGKGTEITNDAIMRDVSNIAIEGYRHFMDFVSQQQGKESILDDLYNINTEEGLSTYISVISLDIASNYAGRLSDGYHYFIDPTRVKDDFSRESERANARVAKLFDLMNEAILTTLDATLFADDDVLAAESAKLIGATEILHKIQFNLSATDKEVYKKVLAEYFRQGGNDISEVYTDLLSAAHDLDMAQSASLSTINQRYIKLLLVFDSMNRNIRAKTISTTALKYPSPHDNYYFDMGFAFRPDYFATGLHNAPMLGDFDVLSNETYVSGQRSLYNNFNTKLQNIINDMETYNLSADSYSALPPAIIEDHKLVSRDIKDDIHKKFGWGTSPSLLAWSPKIDNTTAKAFFDIRQLIFDKSIERSATETILDKPSAYGMNANYSGNNYYESLLQDIIDGTSIIQKGIIAGANQRDKKTSSLLDDLFKIKADIIQDNNLFIVSNKDKALDDTDSSILDLVALKYDFVDTTTTSKILSTTKNYYSTQASEDNIELAIREIFKNDDLTKIIISLLYDKYATDWDARGGAAARAAFEADAIYDLINEKIWFYINPNDPSTNAAWAGAAKNTKRVAIKNNSTSQLSNAASFDTFFFKYQRDVIGHERNVAYKVAASKTIYNLYSSIEDEVDTIAAHDPGASSPITNYSTIKDSLVSIKQHINDIIKIEVSVGPATHEYVLADAAVAGSNFNVNTYISNLQTNIVNIQVIIDFIDLYLKENKFIEYNKNLFNYDIRYWNVSAADNMDNLFKEATDFNEDISRWDVSNVTSMKNMFDGASVFNQNIGRWEVNNVIDVTKMFKDADAFNQKSIRWWSLDEDAIVDDMFVSTTTGRAIDQNTDIISGPAISNNLSVTGTNLGPDGDLTNNQIEKPIMTQGTGDNKIEIFFNKAFKPTSKTELRKAIAYYMDPGISNKLIEIAGGLPETYDTNIKEWDMTSMASKDLSNLFTGTYYGVDFSKFNKDIGNWNVENVENMSGMFKDTELFNQDISSWDVGEVTNMSSMFEGAKKFNNGDKSFNDWNVENVENMSFMFKNTEVFNELIGMWDVKKVTTMQSMFEGAKMFDRDLQWHTRDVTNLSFMFKDAVNFNGDVTTFFTDNVTTMESMFEGAVKFDQRIFKQTVTFGPKNQQVTLISWQMGRHLAPGIQNRVGVTNIKNMFNGATNFGTSLAAKGEVSRLRKWNLMADTNNHIFSAFENTYLRGVRGVGGVAPFNTRGFKSDPELSFNQFQFEIINFERINRDDWEVEENARNTAEAVVAAAANAAIIEAASSLKTSIANEILTIITTTPEKTVLTTVSNAITGLNLPGATPTEVAKAEIAIAEKAGISVATRIDWAAIQTAIQTGAGVRAQAAQAAAEAAKAAVRGDGGGFANVFTGGLNSVLLGV